MVDSILNILEKNNITDYNIFDEVRESFELFFIKRKLDMTRSKEVKEIRLRVYRDFTENDVKYKGSSDIFIYPGMEMADIETSILSAYQSALYVKNPYYKLVDGIKEASLSKERNLADEASKAAKALFKGEETVEDAFINSAEIFANKKTVRILTSKGTDVTYTKYNVEGEFVVQSLFEGNDVEQYTSFDYDEIDEAVVCDKCKKALLMVKDRAIAKKTDIDFSEYPIIITDSYVGDLLSLFVKRADAAYIYPKYSSYKKGYRINDKLNITGIPKVPYTSEGVKMVERPLISGGVVENIHGSMQYLDYLNEEQIGQYIAIKSDNADVPLSEICSGKYIMVKNFSDFQIDAFDGHFGGEFRLAYLCDGNEKTIITGGTVSGNLLKNQDKMIFSKERYADALMDVPAAVKIG